MTDHTNDRVRLLIAPHIAQHRHIVAHTVGGRALAFTHMQRETEALMTPLLWPLALFWGLHKPWLMMPATPDILVDTIARSRIIRQTSRIAPLPKIALEKK